VEQLSDTFKAQACLFTILLSAMAMRVAVGLVRPELPLEGTVIVGLATVVFLLPTLHRLFHGEELLTTTRQKLSHTAAMVLSAGLFLFWVALPPL
jgi:hypothetical protein